MISRVAAALFLAAAVPAGAQTFAIVGGTVALGDGSAPIPNGTVVVRDGRIVAAGDVRMKLPDGDNKEFTPLPMNPPPPVHPVE